MSDQPLVSPDELASVLGSGENADEAQPETGVADGPFSLRRPAVFGPEEMPAAEAELTRLATNLQTTLAGSLRTELTLRTHGFQQQQVAATLERITGPLWLLVFERETFGGGLALGLSPSTALALVELTLGGSGTYAADGREPTRLEHRVMRTLALSIGKPLAKAFGTSVSARFCHAKLPRSFASPNEIVGASLVDIVLPRAERNALLLASADLLKPRDESDEPDPRGPILGRELRATPVRTQATLAAGHIRLGDLNALKPGECLPLDVSVDRPWRLTANGVDVLEGSVQRAPTGQMRFEITAIGSGTPDPSPAFAPPGAATGDGAAPPKTAETAKEAGNA